MHNDHWLRQAVVLSCLLALPPASATDWSAGQFQGTAAGVHFDVDGRCQQGRDILIFDSDEAGSQDSDGDGMVVRVFHPGHVWTLLLEKDGKTIFSSGPGEFQDDIEAWSRDGERWILQTTLTNQDGESVDIDAVVSCG